MTVVCGRMETWEWNLGPGTFRIRMSPVHGERFSFLWYQLKTLDLSDLNSGVKNLVYMERSGTVIH